MRGLIHKPPARSHPALGEMASPTLWPQTTARPCLCPSARPAAALEKTGRKVREHLSHCLPPALAPTLTSPRALHGGNYVNSHDKNRTFLLCPKSFEANLCHVPRKHIHLSGQGTKHQESQSQQGPEPGSKALRKHTGAARGQGLEDGPDFRKSHTKAGQRKLDGVRALTVRALQAQGVEPSRRAPGRPNVEKEQEPVQADNSL